MATYRKQRGACAHLIRTLNGAIAKQQNFIKKVTPHPKHTAEIICIVDKSHWYQVEFKKLPDAEQKESMGAVLQQRNFVKAFDKIIRDTNTKKKGKVTKK